MFFRCSLVRIWFVWRHHHHLRRRWRLQWRRRLENSNDFNLYTLHVNVSARASCNISNFISRFEGNLSSVWRQKSAVFRLVLHFCSIVVQCDNDFDAVSTFNNIVVARLAVLHFFYTNWDSLIQNREKHAHLTTCWLDHCVQFCQKFAMKSKSICIKIEFIDSIAPALMSSSLYLIQEMKWCNSKLCCFCGYPNCSRNYQKFMPNEFFFNLFSGLRFLSQTKQNLKEKNAIDTIAIDLWLVRARPPWIVYNLMYINVIKI